MDPNLDSPIFLNVTGISRGNAVSADTLRKHVTQAFGKPTASHSLRKGGAIFYARSGVPEEATRRQGGWRTTDVMKSIYTKFSQNEVDAAISGVLDSSSLVVELRRSFRALGNSSEEVLAQSASKIRPFLAYVAGHVKLIDAFTIQHSKITGALKLLSRHEDEHVRNHAIHLHTIVRCVWASAQSAARNSAP